jgi:hypothetical protein
MSSSASVNCRPASCSAPFKASRPALRGVAVCCGAIASEVRLKPDATYGNEVTPAATAAGTRWMNRRRLIGFMTALIIGLEPSSLAKTDVVQAFRPASHGGP